MSKKIKKYPDFYTMSYYLFGIGTQNADAKFHLITLGIMPGVRFIFIVGMWMCATDRRVMEVLYQKMKELYER